MGSATALRDGLLRGTSPLPARLGLLALLRGHWGCGEIRRQVFGDARGGCRGRLVHGAASDDSLGRYRIRGREDEAHGGGHIEKSLVLYCTS